MRLFVIVALIAFAIPPSARNQQQNKPQENGDRATIAPNPSSPVTVVVGQPFSIPQKESAPAQTKNWYDLFWPPIWSNWALVLAAAIAAKAAIHTLHAIDSQVIEMRKTGEQTDKLIKENIAQSTSLECSVRETARFATAMEGVSNSLETLLTFPLKLSGVSDSRCEPTLLQPLVERFSKSGAEISNLWLARSFKITVLLRLTKSDINPNRLYCQFHFLMILPIHCLMLTREKPSWLHGSKIKSTLWLTTSLMTPRLTTLEAGNGHGLYIWGIIEYEDVFGEPWHTRFCQLLTWPDGKTVYGLFIPGHNDGT